ncbi:MAG: hypothetical protein IH946_00100 [Bacteroidetes bacterium]|nr:hypothetical protein [Bacteroidota bacterium]
MKKTIYILSAAVLVSIWSCTSVNSKDEDNSSGIKNSIGDQPPEPIDNVSQEIYEELVSDIPSPLEISALIKASGANFNDDFLNPTENSENYLTKKVQAINLGIYGGDLGYINMYDEFTASIVYLETIKEQANDLKVGHFFDFATLQKLATHGRNMDSLLYISTSGLEKMNIYLRDRKRGDLSALIVTGGWIEVLYICTQVARKHGSPELLERIGEQKIVIDQLLILLNMYKNDPYFNRLITDFTRLKETFDKVKIVYSNSEPTTQEIDGMLVVIDNSSSMVEIDSLVLEEIISTTASIRNRLIKG